MVLVWGNLTECKMCLDSDFFDLWRSCGDCNITSAQPQCQLSCEYCLAGEGLDTADRPAPRADQVLAIPAAGCSVNRRDFQVDCRPLSEGTCGDIPSPSTSGRGCQPCPTSNFVNDCQGCTLNNCLVSCESCLATNTLSNRTGGPPVSVTIPDGGCQEAVPNNGTHVEPEKLVHASVINPKKIRVCRKPNGEEWLLGKGSFGMVYKAKMGRLDVAVKTIHRQIVTPHLTHEEGLQFIRRELKILEMLPFDRRVVQLYGSCTKGSNIVLVLELMQGGDLWTAIKGKHTSPALRWNNSGAQIALDIINGLHFLHSHRIMHRDIKSGNILLSQDFSSAKICDVGLARIMGNTSISSSSHNVQTTWAYAAPEILLYERSDQRADIFSYGVVLWELITQEHPERGVLREFKVPQECPQAVSDMVFACFNRDPSCRPKAEQIIQVIESSMADNPAGA